MKTTKKYWLVSRLSSTSFTGEFNYCSAQFTHDSGKTITKALDHYLLNTVTISTQEWLLKQIINSSNFNSNSISRMNISLNDNNINHYRMQLNSTYEGLTKYIKIYLVYIILSITST